MSWGIALFLIAAVILVVWYGRVQLSYFGQVKRRAAAEIDARRHLGSQDEPGGAASTPVTVMLTPPLVEAVDRFIAMAGETRRSDRADAVRRLMVETLVGLELLSTDERPKDTEPRP